MGSCLSKKSTCSCSTSSHVALSNKKQETEQNTLVVEKKKLVEGNIVRKEVFVIKHRISHEGGSKDENGNFKNSNEVTESAPLRITSSSCTKEELDAILIQCGRLSRNSSTSKGVSFSGSVESSDNTNYNHNRSRKNSSSNKSFDFDYEKRSNGVKEDDVAVEDDVVAENRVHRRRQRERHSSQERRRTLSREREQTQQQQQQRSGSRERCSIEGSRRVSRSPGRRSESPRTVSNGANLASTNANGMNVKMVAVPATVSSIMMDKSNDAGGAELISTATIQRIQVKRNVGAASPRAQSPARVSANVSNENRIIQQQPLSISRSNSRRKGDSPFRRNPLSEIDTPVVTEPMPFYPKKLNAENLSHGRVREQQQLEDEVEALRTVTRNAAGDVVASGLDSLVPQGMRRSRSPRLYQDLDINLGVMSNPTQSYTDLLLQDIQNFHQKSSNPAFSLPPCITKACSILEAVADLNSSNSSNASSAFSVDKKSNPTVEQLNKNTDTSSWADTFRRETDEGSDTEELESAGSNTFAGDKQRLFSQSSREPNSAESTDSWALSKSYSRLHFNPLALQKHTVYESGHDMDGGKRRPTANKMDSNNQHRGIGRYCVEPRGLQTSMAVTAASTYLI